MLTTIIIIIVLFFIFVITYLVSNYLLTRSTHFWRAFPVEPAVVYMKLFWLSAGSFTCCTPLQKTFWVKVLGNTFKRRQVWVLSYVEWFCTFCGQIEKKNIALDVSNKVPVDKIYVYTLPFWPWTIANHLASL